MTGNEYGPFDDEGQVLATRAAAALRAAFDAHPGAGAGDPERLKLLTGACEAAGVDLGDYDIRLLRWLARYENTTCVQLAGMIHRAHQAGLAAQRPEGTVTEWAISYTHTSALFPQGRKVIQPYPDEGMARAAAAKLRELAPEDGPRVMFHEVGPWTPAPEEAGGSA